MRGPEVPDPLRSPAATALVLIPGTVNYFYNTTGHRIAEALTELGFSVKVRSLAEIRDGGDASADLCLAINLGEVLHGFGDQESAVRRLKELGPFSLLATVTLDSVRTNWFQNIVNWCDRAEVGTILDLGLIDQSEWLAEGVGDRYRFVPDGLTASERQTMEAVARDDDDRPIPWAFVGHLTADRAGFVDFLVGALDPSGFVYMPPLEPYPESGSPHLNHDQFLSVLGRSTYHLWCSHHQDFYMEPERFRLSMLSGCVPIKVLMDGQEIPDPIPLRPFVLKKEDLAEALRSGRQWWYRRSLFEAYRKRSLSAALKRVLTDLDIECPAPARAAPKLLRLATA